MSANITMPSNSLPAKSAPNFFSGVGCWGSLTVVLVSLLLYVLACALPAMVFDKETWRGIEVLLIGWQGVFLGQFAWFANLFWFLSLIVTFLRWWIVSLAVTAATTLIAFDAFSFVGTKVPLDEAFVNTMIFQSYRIGFYFWLASILTVGIGAIVMWIIVRLAAGRRV